MSLTQIPLQEPPPPAPPEKNLPEQGDLFDAVTWESAYREMHDFPTLLIQARDELARSRKREAFWMSLVAHFILILLFANSNRLAKFLPHRTVMIVANSPEKKDLTFLELPPDAQKVIKPPKTNVLSDKTRIAESRSPKLDQQQLKKLLDAMKAGRQSPPTQPQQPPAAAQAQPPQQQPQPKPAEPTTTAKLQVPQTQQPQQRSPFEQRPMSAEQAINQAQSLVFGVADDRDQRELAKLYDLLGPAMERISLQMESGQGVIGVPSGFVTGVPFGSRSSPFGPIAGAPIVTAVQLFESPVDVHVSPGTVAGDEVVLTELAGCGHFDVIDPLSPAWPAVLGAFRRLKPG